MAVSTTWRTSLNLLMEPLSRRSQSSAADSSWMPSPWMSLRASSWKRLLVFGGGGSILRGLRVGDDDLLLGFSSLLRSAMILM